MPPRSKRLSGPTRAYARYEELIERSLNLAALQPSMKAFLTSTNTPSTDVDADDLVRAAVVLAVAAMDSYFTDVFAELLVPFLKNKGHTKELVCLLSNAGLDTAVALELLSLDRPYRKVRSLVESHFSDYTTQRMQVIDDLFKCFGIKNLTVNAEQKTQKQTLRKRIEKLVIRRHAIVHDGDRDSRGKFRSIRRLEIKNKIKHSAELVAAADSILTEIVRPGRTRNGR